MKMRVSKYTTQTTVVEYNCYVHFVGTAEVLINEEAPPPLPERTPESYILALDAG